MPSITSLVNQLRLDFPDYAFTPGNDFHWSPQEQTIFYASRVDDSASLLHELAHAVLGHDNFSKDIELLEMERDAWGYARQRLASRYGVGISETTAETALDTYRDWLHARSTCPTCTATGLQIKKSHYRCLACATTWRVNDARVCALRRYTLL